MDKLNSRVSNTTALAYIGDAVYEVFIRKYVMENGTANVNALNKKAISYVCADGQAKAVRGLMENFLTEEETALVKRGRNHSITSRPRGSTPTNYKLATGFEALIGFLYLNGDNDRLEEVVKETIRLIEER
jgi:Uncharacterized protein conserved in bacteria